MKTEKMLTTGKIDNNHPQNHRLQLLAQAIDKVESQCSQETLAHALSNLKAQQTQYSMSIDSMSSSTQHQELLMQLVAQQNIATVMAAAAAAAAATQLDVHQRQKHEPISPPSTSSASSTAESPIDFSSRRSTDDTNEYSSPQSLSPIPNQQTPILTTMLQNLQSPNSFPLLLTNKNGKPTRPFKAYPREPLMLPLGFGSNTSLEQANMLADAASRAIPNRKRLAQTQERLKQRLQQQLLNPTHFVSSSGAQILQPPKKRHRMIEDSIINDEKNTAKNNNDETNNAIKDDAYWERRRKNNEAAKRSRDARRAKEDEIALR